MGFVLVCFIFANVARGQQPSAIVGERIYDSVIRQIKQTAIVGDCVYDSVTFQMTCTYVVFSGIPALSHLIFPIPKNCDQSYTVISPYFNFESPQTYTDVFCGEIYGIKSDRELGEGQVEQFTVIYDGVQSYDVGTIYAALKGGANCEIFSVPAVIECPLVPSLRLSLEATDFVFKIKKPGAYGARLATMSLTSNTPVSISFKEFGELVPAEGFDQNAIPAYYATAPFTRETPPDNFLSPIDFNNHIINIPGDEIEYRFSIWTRIEVTNQNSACEYTNKAVIQLLLENSLLAIDANF